MAWSQHKLNFIWKPFWRADELVSRRWSTWETDRKWLWKEWEKKKKRKTGSDCSTSSAGLRDLTRRTLYYWRTLRICSSLDGSQGIYCALLPCQQCQCVHVCVCDCVCINIFTASLSMCTNSTQRKCSSCSSSSKWSVTETRAGLQELNQNQKVWSVTCGSSVTSSGRQTES